MKINENMVEQRRSPRRSALMQAAIFHPLQTERLRCTVRDISQDGALVDFPNPMDLPALFWLRLEGEATLRLCTIAWRSQAQLGVEFSEQIMERQRIERWTQTHADWSKLRAQRQGASAGPGIPSPIRWSASLVCLRAN
jgi:PilZ domain